MSREGLPLGSFLCLSLQQRNTPRLNRGKRNALVKIKTHHAKEWCKIITYKYNRNGSVQRSHASISFNTSVYNCSKFMGYLNGESTLMKFGSHANLK